MMPKMTDAELYHMIPSTGLSGPADVVLMQAGTTYSGPWNTTLIVKAENGGKVSFGSLTQDKESWIRVSSCDNPDGGCTSRHFLGYATPNATLMTELGGFVVEMYFGKIVSPEWFPLKFDILNPMCTYQITDTCISQYGSVFGCNSYGMTTSPVVPTLHSSNPCFEAINLQKCMVMACSSCDTECSMLSTMPNATASKLCERYCARMFKPNGFCAPSCKNSMVGNGVCNAECMNPECQLDGGDCSTYGMYRRAPVGGNQTIMFDSFDLNGDGLIKPEEFVEKSMMGAPPGAPEPPAESIAMMFKMADDNGDGGIDLYESLIALRQGPPTSIDHILDDRSQLDYASLNVALTYISLLDTNFDGELFEKELGGFVDGEDFKTLNGMGLFPRDQTHEKDDITVSINDLAHVVFGIYMSLSGRTLSDPPFDNAMATKAVFALADWHKDGRLSMGEAQTLGFSFALVAAMDEDGDYYLSMDELLRMQKTQMAAGCAGTVLLTDREVDVRTKAPLTGMVGRKCSFLMMPDWFYPKPHMAGGPGAPMPPTGGSRRLLSVEQQTTNSAVRGVVMTRSTGPVPNHHLLTAKAVNQVPRAVHHGRRLLQMTGPSGPMMGQPTPLDMGEAFNITGDVMPWLVTVKEWQNQTGTWQPACVGALIHDSFVIVPRSCAKGQEAPSSLQLHFFDGLVVDSAGVLFDPLPDAHGNPSVALVQLMMKVDNIPTVQLHDGGGLDLSECKKPMVAVGKPAQMGPEMGMPAWTFTMQAVDVVKSDECSKWHSAINRVNVVSDSSICTKPRHGATKVCFDNMEDSILVAPHPEHPEQYVVVGIKAWEGGVMPCSETGLPNVYSHVGKSLNWILSLPPFGTFPPQLLSVETSKLHITHGQGVHVVSGSLPMGAMVGSVETKCSTGGTYWDEQGLGSLIVTIDAPPMQLQPGPNMTLQYEFFSSDIVLDFEVTGCGATPPGMPGSPGMECGKLPGCIEKPPMNGMPPECHAPMCHFSKDWRAVTKELQANGKAFTGGLGGESEVNGAVEFRQWMCARDWDVSEQLACNVGPGELACFRYEERTDVFEPFGRNVHKKIVSPPKQMEGMAKERRGLTPV